MVLRRAARALNLKEACQILWEVLRHEQWDAARAIALSTNATEKEEKAGCSAFQMNWSAVSQP
jgi:hypothetical protein